MNDRVRLSDSTPPRRPRPLQTPMALHLHSKCAKAGRRGHPAVRPIQKRPRRLLMAKLTRPNIDKQKVKSFLSQPIRIGFLSVPLWAAGAYFLAKRLRARRRYA